jgi:hypothetical protein
MTLDDLVGLLGATRNGTGWAARCPAHDDQNPSLTISEGATQPIVLHCHAGCPTERVVAAIPQLSMADLMGEPRIVASYPYTDLGGNLLYVVNRWSPKDFRTVPAGVPEAQRTLYRRDVIEYARANRLPLYVVEGEKDVDALFAREVCATTAPHGAKAKWLPQYTELLTGMHVTVVADNDEPGVKRAQSVYAELRPACASVSIVKPAYGNDVSDLLDAGYDLAGLEPISEVGTGLTILDADKTDPTKITWAWQGYIPFGSITLIDGDPGSAKSTLSVDLVARWSNGRVMPDGTEHSGPHTSIMVSAEDDPSATIVPRLIAAGADRKRVKLVTAGLREDIPFNLGVDFTALREAIVHFDAKYLVLDPLTAFLPSGTDTKMDAEVRQVLGPLSHMARQLNIAVVVIRHLTKSATSAMYAGSGSVGFIAAARAGFMVTHDPTKGTEHRVLAPIKMNLAPMPPSLSYTVEPSMMNPDVANLQWHGEVTWDAQGLMDAKRGVGPKEREDTQLRKDAKAWLVREVGEACEAGGIGLQWDELCDRAYKQTSGYLKPGTLERVRDDVIYVVCNPRLAGEPVIGWYWQVRTSATSATSPEPDGPEKASSVQAKLHNLPDSPSLARQPAESTEEWLDEQPWACDVPNCPTTGQGSVNKWADPYWTVRCWEHRPDE